jgi:hypothetical protein
MDVAISVPVPIDFQNSNDDIQKEIYTIGVCMDKETKEIMEKRFVGRRSGEFFII